MRERFWERVRPERMTPEEWEALCDGCGKCCLNKLEDEETGEVALTRVACRLLDNDTCRCAQYPIRHQFVPECIVLTPATLARNLYWLPQTCAYRLRHEGRPLHDWHPLVSGDGSVVDAVFKCRIDQIERMAQVSLPAPAGGPPVAAQVPQVAAVRIGERFRWPASHTLVVALGLVPWPVPAQNGVVAALIPDVERRDVVVVVEPRLGGP